MPSLNRAEIIGHLGKDPEIRTFQNGGRCASFSVATSQSWKDKSSGEKKTVTQWHNIAIFNEHDVNFIEKYAKKGTLIRIVGQIETRKYTDKEGVERYSTEIVVRPFGGEVMLFGGKSDGDTDQPEPRSGGTKPAIAPSGAMELDDSIPFGFIISLVTAGAIMASTIA